MLPFLDISGFQPDITLVDWVGIRHHFSGCGIKATEGAHTNDPTYLRHIAGAHAAGVPFTPYHFAHPELHGAGEEARHFANVIGKTPLIPTLDIEQSVGARVNVDAWVREFCKELRKLLHVTPMIYTYSGYLSHFRKPPPGNGLWIANYNRNDGKLHPVGSVAPWRSWRLHQYTSRGRTPYVDGFVDMSAFRPGARLPVWNARK